MESNVPKKRDRTNENFQRAAENIMRRCDEINRRYQADVYILVRRRNRHYEYKSADDPSWPTPAAEVVGTLRAFYLILTNYIY